MLWQSVRTSHNNLVQRHPQFSGQSKGLFRIDHWCLAYIGGLSNKLRYNKSRLALWKYVNSDYMFILHIYCQAMKLRYLIACSRLVSPNIIEKSLFKWNYTFTSFAKENYMLNVDLRQACQINMLKMESDFGSLQHSLLSAFSSHLSLRPSTVTQRPLIYGSLFFCPSLIQRLSLC